MLRLDELILFAYKSRSHGGGIPILPHDAVESLRKAAALSPGAFFDCFARRVAHEYFAANLTFEIADCAMNSLGAYCLAQYDVTLPSYAYDVFLAFDQGESHHPDDDDSVDPEAKYTKPAIAALVVRDGILAGGCEAHPGL